MPRLGDQQLEGMCEMTPTKKAAGLRVVRTTRIVAVALIVGGLGTVVGGAVSIGALTSHATKSVVISTFKSAKYGTILQSGRTVYILKSPSAACDKSCISIWPEVLLPKGVAKAT